MDWNTTGLLLFVFLVSLALLCNRAIKEIPSRLRADQAPRSEFGIVAVDGFGSSLCTDPNGFDIIFVHGLGSNPDTTWQMRNDVTKPSRGDSAVKSSNTPEDICWVTKFLPEDIDPVICGKIRVFFYNHDSYWKRDAIETRLWNLGSNMLHCINSEIRRTEEERSRSLIFVGYSYGGLVIKRAFIQASNKSNIFANIAEHTKAVLFLGTPHRGSSLTTWGSIVARALQPLGSNPAILADLIYDSPPLLDLHREFIAVAGNDLRVVNFFEQRKTSILKIWFCRWTEYCVREQSATFEGSQVQNIGLDVDHYGLNKFGSRTPAYKMILSKLRDSLMLTSSKRKLHVYSVPLETVHTYTERRNLSSMIEEKLRKPCNNDSLAHALVIYGLGGTGKTQLALKFVENHREEYNPILWIDARSPETVQSSFERCVDELQLSVGISSKSTSSLENSPAVQTVLRWLRNQNELHDEWLVVVDNADDLTWGVNKIIPKGSRGNVVITSQDDQSPRLFGRRCEKLHVDTMERSEANALLLQHLGQDFNLISDNVQKVSDVIVDRLGYFALAVDLAGAYIREDFSHNSSNQEAALKRYLANYGKHQDALLQNEYFKGLSPYDKTVWTAWDTTLKIIESRHPESRANLLFAFLARFKRDIIQDEMFRVASLGFPATAENLCQQDQDLPDWLKDLIKIDRQGWDSFRYREALKPLLRYGLLQQIDGEWPGVAMHSLVQWRATKYEKHQPWNLWYLIFISAASHQILQDEAKPQFRRHMIAHIPAVGQTCLDDMQIDDQRKVFVWGTVGKIYRMEGRWEEAEELFAQQIVTSSRVLGEEHPDTLTSMDNLASIFYKQERWKKAEKLEVHVLETRKRVLGPENPDTLFSMDNLASIFCNQGRWNAAEELFVQVIETGSRVLGQEHSTTSTSMGNLAMTYQMQERWKEAEELLVQVMETRKRTLGQEHPDTMVSMSNLASTYQNQGRWDKAEELIVQVMKTRSRLLGSDHPDTLTSMNNLAFTWKSQGRNHEAFSLMKECFDRQVHKLGPQHPHTKASLETLIMWHMKGNELEAAGAGSSRHVDQHEQVRIYVEISRPK